MSTTHPNFWDKLALKIYPRYIYPTQLCYTMATVNVGMIHKDPGVKPRWKIMDYLFLKKNSTLRFLGLSRQLGFVGDVKDLSSIFELVEPFVDEYKSPNKHVSSGDLVTLTPFDRKFVSAIPLDFNHQSQKYYFTAEDQVPNTSVTN